MKCKLTGKIRKMPRVTVTQTTGAKVVKNLNKVVK